MLGDAPKVGGTETVPVSFGVTVGVGVGVGVGVAVEMRTGGVVGVGVGVTQATDHLLVKAILGYRFNNHKD